VGCDPALNEDISPPSWVTHLLWITTIEVEYDERTASTVESGVENIQDIEPEDEVDTEVFVDLLDDLAIR
jgi:hypothetical protein